MSTKRKSAFSVYSEEDSQEPNTSYIVPRSQKNSQKTKNIKSDKALSELKEDKKLSKPLRGGVSKRSKNEKKEKNKYLKLPAKKFKESIKIFGKLKLPDSNIKKTTIKQTKKGLKKFFKPKKSSQIQKDSKQRKPKQIEVLLKLITKIKAK